MFMTHCSGASESRSMCSPGSGGRRLGPRKQIDLRCTPDRQPHRKARAFALAAINGDAPAMQIDDHLDEVEPHSGSHDARYIAAAVIALEQPIEVLFGNADPAVDDRD